MLNYGQLIHELDYFSRNCCFLAVNYSLNVRLVIEGIKFHPYSDNDFTTRATPSPLYKEV